MRLLNKTIPSTISLALIVFLFGSCDKETEGKDGLNGTYYITKEYKGENDLSNFTCKAIYKFSGKGKDHGQVEISSMGGSVFGTYKIENGAKLTITTNQVVAYDVSNYTNSSLTISRQTANGKHTMVLDKNH